MKQNNLSSVVRQEPKVSLFLVPEDVLDTIVAKQDQILEILEAKKDAALNGYLTEKQAIEKVNKKATWFWQMRKTGQLPFKKIGKTIYYSAEDINSLLRA